MKGAKVDAFFYPKTEGQKTDQQVFFKETAPRLEQRLKDALAEKKGLKLNLVYHCTLSMPSKYRSEPMVYSPHFRTPHAITSTYPQQLSEQLDAAMEVLEERLSVFAQARSGWTLDANRALILEKVDFQPIGGSSYLELPNDLLLAKAVINIKNDDQECFKWSVLAALHPASKDAQRVSYQEYKDELNFDGIDFPVTIDQISKFEKHNPGISVTVIGIDKAEQSKKGVMFPTKLLPLGVPAKKQENHVVLLYWKREEQCHYAWVKSLNRLLSRSKSHRGQTYFCERCFQGFVLFGLLVTHSETYQHFPVQATTMVDQEIKFTQWAKREPTLFRVFGDFECILKECEEEDVNGKSVKTQKHIPCSVAWVLVSDHPDVESRSMLYRSTPTPDMSQEGISE